MGNLTEKSMVSIGMVVALLGGTVWFTKLFWMTEANAVAVTQIQTKQEQYNEAIWQIKEELAKIRGILERGK